MTSEILLLYFLCITYLIYLSLMHSWCCQYFLDGKNHECSSCGQGGFFKAMSKLAERR
jgi:hypothetical protein